MDLQSIIKELNNKGASLYFITEKSTFVQMLGAFAQFERTMIRKR